MEVEGPGAKMVLGDFVLRGPEGLFTAFDRQLEGIRLEGKRRGAYSGLAAAAVPGVYTTVEFLAEEGKRGLYDLRPSGTSRDAVVVAGTERVWLDGEILVRGEDRDYVIDYAAATMTFTGRRVVGQSSRVTIDLQLAAQPYRRHAYGAEVGWVASPEAGKTTGGIRAVFYSERDDTGPADGGSLTELERAALRSAGDSLTIDLASGVDFGERGHGDYEYVEADTLLRPFLRYAGPRWVPAGSGSTT